MLPLFPVVKRKKTVAIVESVCTIGRSDEVDIANLVKMDTIGRNTNKGIKDDAKTKNMPSLQCGDSCKQRVSIRRQVEFDLQ